MASHSTCPKCAGSKFELSIEEVRNANFKLSFIRCSSCGCVVGTGDYYNIGSLIHKLAEKLNVDIKQ